MRNRRAFLPSTAFPQGRGNVSAGSYVDGIEPASSFAATTAVRFSSFNLADASEAERIVGARVTAGFFDVFGVAAAAGGCSRPRRIVPGHPTLSF